MSFICLPVGDMAIAVQFEQEISQMVNQQVINLASRVAAQNLTGIVELVPTYASLMIYYNPLHVSYHELVKAIHSLGDEAGVTARKRRRVYIPTYYGGECGPDLEELARYHQLAVEEVVRLHAEADYLVYMLGFSPGFPYLGGLPAQLATPRLKTPRPFIPAGSVGIAGSQTGIYSIASPGGWQIIGHTPIALFRMYDEQDPFLLKAGDRIKFVSTSWEEYADIAEQIKRNSYTPRIEQDNA